MLERSSRSNPFPPLYGPKPSIMQLGSKTAPSLTPLNPKSLHTKFSLIKKPSLATLHLFSCKALAHVQRVDQSKFGKCAIECIHVGFAQEKKAYILCSKEHKKLFELRDVECEELDAQEQVTIDSDREEKERDDEPTM